MIVSLNEVESLVLKACRGCGTSWGIAEDAAQAARWLAANGIGWEKPLLEVLRQQSALSRPSLIADALKPVGAGLLCPLHTGAALSDLAGLHPHLTIEPTGAPIWLLPFAGCLARGGHHVVVSWSDGAIHLPLNAADAEDIAAFQQLTPQPITVTVTVVTTAPPARPATALAQGVTVDAEAWQALDLLAAKTYVPASLQSRLAGAGAGLSDND